MESTGTNEENLEKIITQKWIAAYTNSIEAWVDHRRTGYPKLPYNYKNDSNSDFGIVPADEFMKRMVFPVGEKNNNASGYASGVSALGGPMRLIPDYGGIRLEETSSCLLYFSKKSLYLYRIFF